MPHPAITWFAMDAASWIAATLRADRVRWHLLGTVRSLALSDGWIGAGFVRNAVWDALHGRPSSPPAGDIDVIWYDPDRIDPVVDKRYETALLAMAPGVRWSVKNQARMHRRNGDAPYRSATDAMRHWPETATSVAVRRLDADGFEVAAPFGLEDLMKLLLRPTPGFIVDKRPIYEDRVRSKDWLGTWPLLRSAE